MKPELIYLSIWVAVATAISVAIIITGSAFPLLAFLIPAMISFEYKD